MKQNLSEKYSHNFQKLKELLWNYGYNKTNKVVELNKKLNIGWFILICPYSYLPIRKKYFK